MIKIQNNIKKELKLLEINEKEILEALSNWREKEDE